MANDRMGRVLWQICGAARTDGVGPTDGQLLGAYVAGHDATALAALVRRHAPMVWRVCRRLLRNECDAEDAFQATFLVLARKASSVVPREMVANWLYGVARQTAFKARATSAKRRTRERQVTDMPDTAAAESGPGSDLVDALDEELARLPDKFRVVVVLCDLEGQTRKAAAGRLGVPEGTIASRLAAARAMLARRLAQRGLAMPAATSAAVLGPGAASAVPPAVLATTIEAAGRLAAGGAISVNAAALAEGVLKAMLLNKLKVLSAGALLATVALGLTVMVTAAAWSALPPAPDGSGAAAAPVPQDKRPGGEKPAPAEDARAKELKSLQGDWKVVGLEADGRKAAADDVKGMRWTFKGDRQQAIDPGEKASEKSEVKLDPEKEPKHIDLVLVEGDRKGTAAVGIYKLEKGRLTVCLREPDAAKKGRPTEFTAGAGSGQAIITLEQVPAAPGPGGKQEPKPFPGGADAPPGKGWVARGADALAFVGADGVVGPPVKLPRFRLEPGQELVYSGEESTGGRTGRGQWNIWVVRANADGGWRVVFRCSSRPSPVREHVHFAWCDLSPDGRIAENDSLGAPLDPRMILPRLPAAAAEAVTGWQAGSERTGNTHSYTLLPPSNAGRCTLAAVCESPTFTAVGVALKDTFTWDSEQGVPEAVEVEVTYADKRVERGVMKLGGVKAHDAAWCRAFGADAERYFAAEAAYRRTLARPGGAAAEMRATLEKAGEDLKAARRGLERDEFRQKVDATLAQHDQQGRAVVEAAERREAVVGQPAVDWATTDLAGKRHALTDYRGKVVVLDFWYRSCVWCVRAMPQVKEVAARFKDQPVVVLGMNTDADEADARFVAEKVGLTYPTLKAAGLPERYKVTAFPTLIVIDQAGVVRDIHSGYSATLKEEVSRSVERLLNIKP